MKRSDRLRAQRYVEAIARGLAHLEPAGAVLVVSGEARRSARPGEGQFQEFQRSCRSGQAPFRHPVMLPPGLDMLPTSLLPTGSERRRRRPDPVRRLVRDDVSPPRASPSRIDLERGKLGRQADEPLGNFIRKAVLQDAVAALDVADSRSPASGRRGRLPRPPRWPRARAYRFGNLTAAVRLRGRPATCGSAEQADELPPLHATPSLMLSRA